jgi:hypothetical protein
MAAARKVSQAANTAVWLAAWGVPVRLAGNALGQDELGDRLWGWLGAYPCLDLRFIERLPGGHPVLPHPGHAGCRALHLVTGIPKRPRPG